MTGFDAPTPGLIHRAMEASAARSPDAPAFSFDGERLSYGDLAERAARLAGTLQAAGVRRGDRVALLFEKSLESAVALFAVLRAGAAYVPLDPAAAPARNAAVLRRCGARVAITRGAQSRAVDALAEAEVVIGPDAAPEGVETIPWSQALAGPEGDASPSELDLAYIIFTSGSTGEPKGIMHSHQSGMAYARMAATLYGLRSDDVLGSLSPLHFDMSTFDYFCGPLAGACTSIVPEPHLRLPASLAELAASERFTIWYSVPWALSRMLLHGEMAAHDLSAIRWVLFGGEPFTPGHLAALTRALPQARFSNVYGPAEVNQCTFHHLPGEWREADGQPPIGRAVPNADCRVVDEAGREASHGELIVRAPTMMRGYWERPELNADVFTRLPGPGGVEETWLRTGDLAEVGPDGLLRFAGRRDRMIKTRGHRVELDEVEAALSAHPAVDEAAAWASDEGEGLVVIAAACTLRRGMQATPEEIAAAAAARLPAYARPARITLPTSFPRTTSGKIDRRRLAAGDGETGAGEMGAEGEVEA